MQSRTFSDNNNQLCSQMSLTMRFIDQIRSIVFLTRSTEVLELITTLWLNLSLNSKPSLIANSPIM